MYLRLSSRCAACFVMDFRPIVPDDVEVGYDIDSFLLLSAHMQSFRPISLKLNVNLAECGFKKCENLKLVKAMKKKGLTTAKGVNDIFEFPLLNMSGNATLVVMSCGKMGPLLRENMIKNRNLTLNAKAEKLIDKEQQPEGGGGDNNNEEEEEEEKKQEKVGEADGGEVADLLTKG